MAKKKVKKLKQLKNDKYSYGIYKPLSPTTVPLGSGAQIQVTPDKEYIMSDAYRFPKKKIGSLTSYIKDLNLIKHDPNKFNNKTVLVIRYGGIGDILASLYGIVEFNGEEYILASAISKGYREYKVSDNYSNRVIALTLSKI